MCIRGMNVTKGRLSYRRRQGGFVSPVDEQGFLLLDVICACAVTVFIMTAALQISIEANHFHKKAQTLRHMKRIGQDVIENRTTLLPSQAEWVHTYERGHETYTVHLTRSSKEVFDCYDVEVQASDGSIWGATKWEERQ
ncbi:MAG: hypothetical protein KHX20_07460 [Megasphaera sp.]|nr:hypothetical protein [Megasphaera sp.]